MDATGPAYAELLAAHYERIFGVTGAPRRLEGVPLAFLVFEPTPRRDMYTYATSGLATPGAPGAIELHLVTLDPTDAHLELLATVARYHASEALGVGHTVSFGRPWLPGSGCDHGLVSLPYLDGPPLENFTSPKGAVQCLWLLPITEAERDYKASHGLESLEAIFEEVEVDYLDPRRGSVV